MTRTERTYYLVFGLYSQWGWFMAPLYPLFLLSRGLDLFQMNCVLAVYLITVFLFEVPTGAVADRFGRKFSFLCSCAVRAVAFGLYAFADDFTDCVVAELIDAIGTTLATGALDAWAIDGMRAEGNTRSHDRFFARAQMLSRVMMVAGGIVAGYIADVDFALPWMVASAGFVVTGVVAAVLMREQPAAPPKDGEERLTYLQTIRAGWRTVRASPELMLLCLVTAVIVFAAVPAHMLWQVRLRDLTGEGIWLMGWVWALVNVVAVVGSSLLPRLLASWSREQVLFVSVIWRAGSLTLAALAVGFWPVLFGILLQEAGFGLSEPVFLAWVNERCGGEQRATVISVRSMFGTLGGGIGLLCLGLVARSYGVTAVWLTSAAIFVLVAPLFLALRSQRAARMASSSSSALV